jgi:dihydrofolate reductase
MSRIVVSQFVSADGVIEDPVGMEGLGRGSWTDASVGDDGAKFKLDELMDTDAMLFGRKTYDAYFAAWPSRDDAYANRLNTMPKYLVSSTVDEPEWANSTVLKGDVAEAARAVKERHAGTIMIQGSAQLADALLEHDLVDEWRLMVFPVIVGKGKRFFGDPGRAVDLRLTESRSVGDGVAIVIYEPARSA